MENSIEGIWKKGFLDEKNLVAPKINDLYNRKSKHLIDKMKRMFRISFIAIIILAVAIPIIYYLLGVLWQGIAASVLLLLTAWYGQRQIRELKTLDQGATSLDYLRSFDNWLKDVLFKTGKTVRYSYPLYFLIALSTMGSVWSHNEKLVLKTQENFPGITFIGGIPLFAIIIGGVLTFLMFYFSDRVYNWDVRLMYGRVFDKLKETIAEMEALKEE